MTDDNDTPFGDFYDHEAAQLRDTMNRFTQRKIRAAEAEHGVTWLGDAGPVYDIWDGNLARALYRDNAGRHYVDYQLFKETLGGDRRKWAWISEAFSVDDIVIEHRVATETRGLFVSECVDVQRLANEFHAQAEALPASLWARTWWSSPMFTDAQELGLVNNCPELASQIPADLT